MDIDVKLFTKYKKKTNLKHYYKLLECTTKIKEWNLELKNVSYL